MIKSGLESQQAYEQQRTEIETLQARYDEQTAKLAAAEQAEATWKDSLERVEQELYARGTAEGEAKELLEAGHQQEVAALKAELAEVVNGSAAKLAEYGVSHEKALAEAIEHKVLEHQAALDALAKESAQQTTRLHEQIATLEEELAQASADSSGALQAQTAAHEKLIAEIVGDKEATHSAALDKLVEESDKQQEALQKKVAALQAQVAKMTAEQSSFLAEHQVAHQKALADAIAHSDAQHRADLKQHLGQSKEQRLALQEQVVSLQAQVATMDAERSNLLAEHQVAHKKALAEAIEVNDAKCKAVQDVQVEASAAIQHEMEQALASVQERLDKLSAEGSTALDIQKAGHQKELAETVASKDAEHRTTLDRLAEASGHLDAHQEQVASLQKKLAESFAARSLLLADHKATHQKDLAEALAAKEAEHRATLDQLAIEHKEALRASVTKAGEEAKVALLEAVKRAAEAEAQLRDQADVLAQDQASSIAEVRLQLDAEHKEHLDVAMLEWQDEEQALKEQLSHLKSILAQTENQRTTQDAEVKQHQENVQIAKQELSAQKALATELKQQLSAAQEIAQQLEAERAANARNELELAQVKRSLAELEAEHSKSPDVQTELANAKETAQALEGKFQVAREQAEVSRLRLASLRVAEKHPDRRPRSH